MFTHSTSEELREAKNLSERKGNNLGNFLPPDLMLQFEEACGYTIHGSSKLTPANKRLSNTDMLRTMNWLITKYNKTAKTENIRRKAHNSEICKRMVLEDITAAEAVVLKLPPLKLAPPP